MRKNSGFTLVEIIVVLAVLGALMAAIAPAAFTYINDARRSQATSDAGRIASAVGKFVQDTALLPYKNNTTAVKVNAKQSGDYDCLYGASDTTVTTAIDSSGSTSWTGGSGGVACQSGSATRDTIDNHLITNTPGGSGTKAYATTGKNAWRGPYLPNVPSDPWGNAYLVNVGRGDPSAATKKAVWVISPGPNGVLETSSDANRASIVTAGSDDIVARIQ